MTIATLLVLFPVALGHLCLLIAFVNWFHGLGWIISILDRAMPLLLAALGAASIAGTFWLAVHPWTEWPTTVRLYGLTCITVSMGVFPAVTIARLLRRNPELVAASRSAEIDLGDDVDNLVGEGPRSWWLRIPGNESLRLQLNEWTVRRPDLPEALDGLSILHLTDLHFARTYARAYFERVIQAAADEEADLVLFTGDLIDDEGAMEWIVPVLSGIRGRLGTYAIFGNHDCHHDIPRINEAIREAGFTMIDGSWTSLTVDRARLAIGGTSAPWGPRLDPTAMPAADARLLLSHTPDLFGWAARHEIDLMFSGHNHGGQVRLPVVGPVLMPSRFGRRYDAGFFASGPTLLYASAGVGAKHPLRWGCPPEISRFVLRTVERNSASEENRPGVARRPACAGRREAAAHII